MTAIDHKSRDRNTAGVRSHTTFRLALGWMIVLAAGGCGLETYEQRLEATRAYYAYLDKLDQNLANSWRSSPVDDLRVPKNFKELPAPVPTKNPDGSLEFPDVDPRQPDFANLTIEGLIGAWRADVDVLVNNERVSRPAYLYAASNSPLYLAGQAEDAVNFTKNFIPNLETALQATGKPELAAVFPKGHQFVPRQTFEVLLLNSDLPIHNSRYSFETYSTQQGDNQVVLLLAVPAGMEPQSKVPERMQMTLESLKLSNQRPQVKAAGAAPAAGTPASPSGNF